MSYADLKPVKFDESANYYSPAGQLQPNPSYYSYQHHQQNDYVQPYHITVEHPQQHQHNVYQQPHPPVQHHHPMHQHPPVHHHVHPVQQHVIIVPAPQQQQAAPQPQLAQPPQDFKPYPMTPKLVSQVAKTPKSTAGKAKKSKRSVSTDDENQDAARNHWMPMTWVERSSDDHSIFNFVCLWDNCVEAFSEKTEFVNHMYGHLNQMRAEIDQNAPYEPVKCYVRGCCREMPAMAELQRHLAMHIFQADCQQKGSEALVEKEEYSRIECCGFEPSTNVHYDGEVLLCQWEDCHMPFTSLTDLFEHTGSHIDSMNDYDRVEQCFDSGERKVVFACKWSGCTHYADSKTNLRRHMRHHSGEKVLACPFCARFFSRRDKLYDHCARRTIIMNDQEEPFNCKLCHKTFGTEKALCMHVTRHLVSRSCPLCGLAVVSRADMHRHLVVKHSSRTKDFKCETCNRCFFSSSELDRHSELHAESTYNCKHCPEKFKWKKQLLKHLREHDENYNRTPYVCHLCDGKAYTSGYALGRHLVKTHSMEVPLGFTRFAYKKCADGLMRLQTRKLFKTGIDPGYASD